MNRTGFSQVGIPYKNFSEFIPQHDSDPHILSLCQHILLSVEISESGRQPESRIPRKSNESRTSYTRIPACGTPYFTDDNKESEQKTKINTRFKRYLNIFAEDFDTTLLDSLKTSVYIIWSGAFICDISFFVFSISVFESI